MCGKNSSKWARSSFRINQAVTLLRPIIFHARAAPSVRTLFAPTLADVRILSAMPQLPEAHCRPSTPAEAPTRRRSCRPGNRAWSWKRQDRAVRAIPLAQVSLYAAVRRGRSVPHAPCGARALTGHPHPVLAQAREVKQRLSDRFLAQGARGRERVNTARSDPTAAVTIAYLSPAQGLLRRRRHVPGGRDACADLLCQLARYHRRHRDGLPSLLRGGGMGFVRRPAHEHSPPRRMRCACCPQAALIEREEASSADAVGRARAKKGALDRMRRTQFRSCSMVSW